jgi:AraC family transcriptional regulator of adaptative response / DNA-3-methyladenine glycosylase II
VFGRPHDRHLPVEGKTYRRTITVKDAPGLLEISPDGADHLLLRAHLPYWENLIHVVDRASRIVGLDADHSAGVEVLSGDPMLGPLVRSRPGLDVSPATRWHPWSALAAAHLMAAQGRSR